MTRNSLINPQIIIWLNKTYEEWKNAKTTISADEEEKIGQSTGIRKTKSIVSSTKDT
jgi:hypothetical protein